MRQLHLFLHIYWFAVAKRQWHKEILQQTFVSIFL